MVSIDEGVTLIPKIACTKTENIKYVAVNNAEFYREIDLVMRKSSVYGDIFDKLIKIISKNY